MKKFLVGLLAAATFFTAPQVTFADVEVPEDIYQWVHSSARGNYYFNFQQTNYAVKDDGTIDLNVIIAPTICTYDNIQIDDVLQKRRWRGLSTANYSDLIGRADYLKFDLEKGTVLITERVNLDSTFTAIDSEKDFDETPLSKFSQNDITRKFYRAILLWARSHHQLMVERSRGHLSTADAKLSLENVPIKKFDWIDSAAN